MPCNIDTIVKIKVVRETEKDNWLTIWAIGCYPIGDEDKEIELTSFVLVDFIERDHDLQAIFQKGEYFSVGGKIVPDKYKDTIRPKRSKIDRINEVNEDVMTDGNANSLDVNNELVNNEVDNDLNNIEQEQAVHKIVHNTRKSSSFKTDIVDIESE
ncbi:31701_t:CDS:2 [Gigaspora margarita]|uniref:31701_t:CDS:1 n=1 Tax=Gigaspora margarita TaxID=4874 RepID=A0ABN7UEM6_GIGMA|nr:31701_t:CDS:2 [Gigaspora margarita]